MSSERPRRKNSVKRLAVVWTDRALSDLETIGEFIAANDADAALRWLDTLMAAGVRAADAPLAGRRVPELGRDDIREVFARRYRIVYRVGRGRIEVLTVFEGHRLFPQDVGFLPTQE